MRIGIAIGLGIVAIGLMFALGGGFEGAAAGVKAHHQASWWYLVGMGGYFLLAVAVLRRFSPKGTPCGPCLRAINAPLLAVTAVSLVIVPDKLAALQNLGTSALGIACSYVGMGIGSMIPGRRSAT